MGKLSAAVKSNQTPILFVSSSLVLSAADFLISVLYLYVLMPGNLPLSIVAGRITGAVVGYLLNRDVVFPAEANGKNDGTAVVRYVALWLANYFAALLLVTAANRVFGMEYWVALVVAGLLLCIPNYLAQRYYVFRRKSDESQRTMV